MTSGWPASVQSSANQCARQDVDRRVVCSARRENSHGPNRWPSLALAGALPPLVDGVPPQGGGGGAEGEPADPAGLGRSDHLVGRGPGDGQHITVQVGELQGGELAPPGAGVRGQSGEQQNLFSAVQP